MKKIVYIFLFLIVSDLVLASSIFIIGDSLSVPNGHGLGRELSKLLEEKGHNVAVVAACGSAPFWYTKKTPQATRCGYFHKLPNQEATSGLEKETPRIVDVLKDNYAPDTIVIQQGTNMYQHIMDQKPQAVVNQVKELLKQTFKNSAKSSCVWIGPPEIFKFGKTIISEDQKDLMDKAIQKGIKESGVDCSYMNSRAPLTQMPGGDGIHFRSKEQTKKWIDAALIKTLEVTKNKNNMNEEICNPEAVSPVLPNKELEVLPTIIEGIK